MGTSTHTHGAGAPASSASADFAGTSPLGIQLRSRGTLVKETLAEFGLTNVRVFGSVATGRDDEKSDIDLLVTRTRPIGLFALAEAEARVGRILDAKVDIVVDTGLRPFLRDRVLAEARTL
jgi:predicted nucleotidyltransferase